MSFESNKFDIGSVLNKLRSIEEAADEQLNEKDPEMSTGGAEIDNSGFTRTMQRLAAIKDAVAEDHYNALRAGVRALYMNRRPNLQQMTALMDLLETVLSYIAADNALFQRLKTDLAKDSQQQAAQGQEEPAALGQPAAQGAAPATSLKAALRGMKS